MILSIMFRIKCCIKFFKVGVEWEGGIFCSVWWAILGSWGGTWGGLSLWLFLWFNNVHYSNSSNIFSQALCELSSLTSPPGTCRGSYPFTHSRNLHQHPRLYHGCYGNIMTMDTPGAAYDITRLLNCGKWKAKQTLDFPPFIIFRFILRKIG